MLVYTDCPLVKVQGRPEPQPRGFVLSALRKPPFPAVQEVIRRGFLFYFLLALPTLTPPLCGVQFMNSAAVFPKELVLLFSRRLGEEHSAPIKKQQTNCCASRTRTF